MNDDNNANQVIPAQSGGITHEEHIGLRAWCDGLHDRLRASCFADGMSEQEFASAFGELAKAAVGMCPTATQLLATLRT